MGQVSLHFCTCMYKEEYECVSGLCRVYDLCRNVKDRVQSQSKKHGIDGQPLISCRYVNI